MVELIIFRHPETKGDMPYIRYGDIYIPYATGRRFLKGQNDNVIYRLTHLGILAAYQTANRIIEFYANLLEKEGRARVDLWHNKSIRSCEGEEITRVVLNECNLGDTQKDIKIYETDDLLERCFGSIEGQQLSELEKALTEVKKIGRIPEYFDLDDALIYCDDFKMFEENLGIKHEKNAETFTQTLERAIRILKEITEQSADAHYVQIFGHKVFILYLIGAVDILESNDGILPEIRDLKDKRRWVKPYDVNSSRFARIGIIKTAKNRYWVQRYHEINDGGHLQGIPSKLTRMNIGEANKIRETIAPWYQDRGISVEVKADEIPPFYMHAGDEQNRVEVLSPVELPFFLVDAQKVPDSFIRFHFMDQVLGGNYDLSTWIKESLGDETLAKKIQVTCKRFNQSTSVEEIRGLLASTIKGYYSS